MAAAGRGDTVQVPTGTANWGTNTLTLTKGIILQGNGAANTIVTTNSASINNPMIEVDPDSTALANDEIIRITGFTFDGNNATNSTGNVAVIKAHLSHGVTKAFKNLAIGNCKFQNMPQTSAPIYLVGQFRGVIYNNIFDRCDMILRTFGQGYVDEFTNGNFPRAYGSSDNLFFENNTIKWTSSVPDNTAPGWIETGQSGRICIRYNSWNFTNQQSTLNNQAQDVHGFANWNLGGLDITGTMIAEWYGNTVSNSAGNIVILHRGTWGLYHNNIITGTGANLIIAQQYGSASTVPGCQSNVEAVTGPLNFSTVLENTYAFNNTRNGTIQPMLATIAWNKPYNPAGSCGVVENTNWYNYNASFDGATGIGRGTSAPSMSATDGVAYWVNATATPSVDPNVVQAGHLYKRVSGAWVDYYHPYTYPHPLVIVAPPTSLRVVSPSPTPTPTP